MTTPKIRALLSLLDDPDQIVFEAVCSALLRQPPSTTLRILEEAETAATDATVRQRLRLIIGRIRFEQLCSLFIDWLEDGAEDLLHGAYLVARFQYPDLEYHDVSDSLDRIWVDLKAKVGCCKSPHERIEAINAHMFSTLQFKHNTSHPVSHANNCINTVLKVYSGNHITLSMIYSIVCQRLGMSVRCVYLPGVMVLAYMDEQAADQPLFYINAANNGEVLDAGNIDTYMIHHCADGIDCNRLPCTNAEVVGQLLRNMNRAYNMQRDNENADNTRKLLDLISVYNKRRA